MFQVFVWYREKSIDYGSIITWFKLYQFFPKNNLFLDYHILVLGSLQGSVDGESDLSLEELKLRFLFAFVTPKRLSRLVLTQSIA